jgi:hypothetical protein
VLRIAHHDWNTHRVVDVRVAGQMHLTVGAPTLGERGRYELIARR